MKKKNFLSSKDKKDWLEFTKKQSGIYSKEADEFQNKVENRFIPKLDLHGCSLDEANKTVEKFITNAFDNNIEKILIVTGKGIRSKSDENPYQSKKFSILKNAVPEYIECNENLSKRIKKIETANIEHGGDGAIYILLKKNKNL